MLGMFGRATNLENNSMFPGINRFLLLCKVFSPEDIWSNIYALKYLIPFLQNVKGTGKPLLFRVLFAMSFQKHICLDILDFLKISIISGEYVIRTLPIELILTFLCLCDITW